MIDYLSVPPASPAVVSCGPLDVITETL